MTDQRSAACGCGWPERDCAIRASGNKPEENMHLSCAERDAKRLAPPAARVYGSAQPALLDVLVDNRGWAETDEEKADATFQWMQEATFEIARLRTKVESLSRVLASRTDHLA